jgi:hypothetical protein
MMFAGLGSKDALILPRTFAKSGQIATRRSKTGEAVFWPMPARLADILDNAPVQMATTLCANSRGTAWTLSGFSASWRTLRIRLERKGFIGPGLTLYGLRHTVAVILRESGADERTIADALGQKSIEMARHYAKGADLSRKMRGGVKNFGAEVTRRRTNRMLQGGSAKCSHRATREFTKRGSIWSLRASAFRISFTRSRRGRSLRSCR